MGTIAKVKQFFRCIIQRLARFARKLMRLKSPTLEERFIAFCSRQFRCDSGAALIPPAARSCQIRVYVPLTF